MDGWMNQWINEWMDGWMNGWMDGWMDEGNELKILWSICLFERATWMIMIYWKGVKEED
jgi:hypothetical protein